MSKTEIPSIRFHGFDDAWEQRKFGDDLISIQTGTNKLGSENGKGTPLLKMGNIQRGYFSLDKIEYLSDGDDVEPENIAYYGDFFFNTRNTLELVGKGATWTGNSGEYAFNSNIARFKLRELDTIFFNYLYNTRSMIEQVHARAMGTTSVAAIYPQSLKSIEYYVPTMAEQQRIGELLLKIDNLITFHQRKFEKLTNVKKSMLEKMFPRNGSCYPEIRFKGFTAPWEQRKLGDIFEEYSEKGHPELPALTIIQGGGTIRRDESDRSLQYDKASLASYKMVNDGDFIVHLRSFEGGLEKATTLGIISPAYHTFHGEGTDSRFYYSYFRSPKFIDQDLKPHVYGIRDGRSIDIEGMKTIEIPWTSFAEQKDIGDYIDTLDNLITLHQRELGKLQSIKKALLEKMFV